MALRGRATLVHENCFFVTTTCYRWFRLLNSEECKKIVSDSIVFLSKKYFSQTLGYVIMPNHIHLIIYFDKKIHLSAWMRDLKKFTAVKIRQEIERNGELLALEELRFHRRKQVFKVWEDRFHHFFLYQRHALETKLHYIHQNPLQEHWNLVPTPEEWLHSSARFYIKGIQPPVTITDYRDFFA